MLSHAPSFILTTERKNNQEMNPIFLYYWPQNEMRAIKTKENKFPQRPITPDCLRPSFQVGKYLSMEMKLRERGENEIKLINACVYGNL